MPRASKSLPVVTLGVVEGHSKLASTPDEMAQRKVLDLKRWYVKVITILPSYADCSKFFP